MHVLVMADADSMRDALTAHLERSGVEVSAAPLGMGAVEHLDAWHPGLVLLCMTGRHVELVELCHALRERASAPILALLDDDTSGQIVRVLRAGADDVLLAPVSMDELDARIESVLRRVSSELGGASERYVDPYLCIDLTARRVMAQDDPVKLSPTEFHLLSCLVRKRGRVVSPQEAIDAAWGRGNPTTHGKLLSLYIGYLRRKIERDPQEPQYIHTRYGAGYWFGGPSDREPA